MNNYDVTATELIQETFGADAKEALIASLPEGHEGGWPVKKWTGREPAKKNENYMVISTFSETEGRVNRRGKNFKALYVVVLDDIGTKHEPPEGWGKPSYIMETSKENDRSNTQWGYFLSEPVTDYSLAKNLLRAMVSLSGYSDKIGDLSRFVRIPGTNHKPGKDEDGRDVKVTEWHPERRYLAEEMAQWVGTTAEKLASQTQIQVPASAQDISDHPLIYALDSVGLLLADAPNPAGWIDVKCPWEELHTNTSGTPTGVVIREDGSWVMSCFHSACKADNEATVFENDRVMARLHELGAKAPGDLCRQIGIWSAQKDFAEIPVSVDETNVRPHLIARYSWLSSVNRFWDNKLKYTVVAESLDFSWAHLLGPKELASKIIKKSPQKTVYGALGFMTVNAPWFEFEKVKYANTYKPPRVKPQAGDVSLWLRLMKHVYGEYSDLVIDHMAFTVQKPEEKIRWQILCTGAPRTGKTLSVKPLHYIFGSHCKTIEVIADEKYDDAYVEGKVIIFEEVWGDKRNYNGLKSKLANDNVETLNPKSKPKVTQQNTYSIYMFSNHEDALSIDEDGDKLLIVEGPKTRLEPEFYAQFGNGLARGLLVNHIYDFLLSRDVSGFSHEVLPVRTDAVYKMARNAAADKDAIDYMVEMAEDVTGLFEYYPIDLPDEHMSYASPLITHDMVRTHLMDKKLWNRGISVPKLMEACGFELLTHAQYLPWGRCPRVYVDKKYGIGKLSKSQQFVWVVKHIVLTKNVALMSGGVKSYLKENKLTPGSILQELGVQPKANLD